jgi:hypothetical protein
VFGVCKGAFAEFACGKETELAPKPERLSFEQAASAPIAGITALQGLRDCGRVQPGQRVLIGQRVASARLPRRLVNGSAHISLASAARVTWHLCSSWRGSRHRLHLQDFTRSDDQ